MAEIQKLTENHFASTALFMAALREAGTEEIRGAGHNRKIVEWFRIAGAGWIDNDEQAWCSAFMCAMAESVGLHHPKSVRARRWLELEWPHARRVESIDELVPGDVVVFRRGTSRTAGHVAIFAHRFRSKLVVLGGNQRDAVRFSEYPIDTWLGGRRLEFQSEVVEYWSKREVEAKT